MGLIAIIPAIPIWIEKKTWGLALTSVLAWLWTIVLLFWKRPGLRFRSAGVLLVFFTIGIFITVKIGADSSGSIWLFSFSVLAGALIGFWGAITAVSLNGAAIAIINLLIYKFSFLTPEAWYSSPIRAISAAVNFLILNIVVSVSVSVLFRALETALKKEALTASELKLEQKRLQREISERKDAERALRSSEELFRVLADESPLGISLLDRSKRFKYINPQFTRLFGYLLDEMPLEIEWLDRICPAPDHRRDSMETCRFEAQRSSPDSPLNRVFNVACKSGETKSVQFRSALLADGGLITIYEDITDRVKTEKALMESEKRFRELADFLPEATYETDINGVVTFLNQKGFELLQLDSDDIKAGFNVLSAVSPTDRDKALENMESLLNGVDTGLVEQVGLRKDGRTFPALVRNSAIIKDGRAVGIRGIIIDVTETKTLERQLQQAQKMEAVGVLAGGIAHDFNNILAIMFGCIETAQRRTTTREAMEPLNRLQAAAERAADLVKRILAFSRQADQKRRPVDLTAAVKDCLDMVKAALPSTIDIREEFLIERAIVSADSTQLQQVLINLCTNASHAMGPNGGILTVGISGVTNSESLPPDARLEPGRSACLWVSDTGTGVPPEIMHKIFDPYFTTKDVGEGVGLGLSLVHGIVKHHYGCIKIENNPEGGACFKLFFPLINEAAEVDVVDVAPKRTGSEKIMLVDDEPEIVELSVELLQELGYEVKAFTDSLEALIAFQKAPDDIEIVVTDQTMPHMTGLQLAAEIRKLRSDIPIIICSGFNCPPDQEHTLHSRRIFLNKPFKIKDLACAVRSLLDQ